MRTSLTWWKKPTGAIIAVISLLGALNGAWQSVTPGGMLFALWRWLERWKPSMLASVNWFWLLPMAVGILLLVADTRWARHLTGRATGTGQEPKPPEVEHLALIEKAQRDNIGKYISISLVSATLNAIPGASHLRMAFLAHNFSIFDVILSDPRTMEAHFRATPTTNIPGGQVAPRETYTLGTGGDWEGLGEIKSGQERIIYAHFGLSPENARILHASKQSFAAVDYHFDCVWALRFDGSEAEYHAGVEGTFSA